MQHLEGNPISPGFATGIAVVYDYEIERIIELPERFISHAEVKSECIRLDDALEQSSEELKSIERIALREPKLARSAALSSAHSTMAQEITEIVRVHIGRELVNAEQALDAVIRELVQRFERLDNVYFREREQDVRDVGRRMMRHLSGSPLWLKQPLPSGSVIVARELLPSEAVWVANSGVSAIVSEHGGTFSHTAIVARSLGIPAVFGISNATAIIQSGTRLLVDGETGSIVLNPSKSEEESFAVREYNFRSCAAAIAADEELPSRTQDGVDISLLGNIGLPMEASGVSDHNLNGVGLFRTEFLFIEAQQRPSLDTQVKMYGQMADRLGDRPLVIRTFDLGGDKLPPFLQLDSAATRASLHLRGLRFSLVEAHLLDTQLQAILKVAQTANVRVLFPMVIGPDDLSGAIAAICHAADQLGVPHRPPIGAMIETPAALYALDEILAMVDFIAIGTNDLTQYMLAADRDLAEGTDNLTAMHPAVLRAIKQIIDAAQRRNCPVCVCGEDAGDPVFACLLVGLGIRELSLTPTRAGAVRNMLRSISCDTARELADLSLHCHTPQQVREILQQLRPQEKTAASNQNRLMNEPTTLAIGDTSIAVPPNTPVSEPRKSLSKHRAISKCHIVESPSELSEVGKLSKTATQDERLAAVAFQTHDSILITDRNGKILRVNDSFTALTGYAPEDVIGKTPRILKSGRHGHEFYRLMWQTIQQEGYWQGEIWNRRKDGHIYLQRLTIACVKNESGETTHYVGDGQDLTQQKQGESDFAAIHAAQIIQQALLPSIAPKMAGFDIAGVVLPADRMSGDFLDYIPIGPDVTGFVVADVSGHGVGPALLMAQARSYLRVLVMHRSDPAGLLIDLNRLVTEDSSEHFMTMFLGFLNSATRTFIYAGAGHQAYLIDSNGATTVLEASCVPIGIHTSITGCSASTVVLEPGDTLLMSTDGITESMCHDGQLFGQKRLLDVVKNGKRKTADQLVQTILRTAGKFSEQGPQKDDITILVIRALPSVVAQ